MYKRFIKRLIDIALSGMGIIVLAVPMLILAVAVKLDSPGPVLFKQKRIGLHKRQFDIMKFRTMRTETPAEMPTHMLTNPDQWITKLGKFMRKTSLDELPQLFNIFSGQMSVIGPRPVLAKEQDLIKARDRYGANDVLPGLTGWAQINGRDELDAATKAKLDGEYVEKMSFLFDCKCFFSTIPAVLRAKGVIEGCTTPSSEEAAAVTAETESQKEEVPMG